jgi:hypothetical protein
VGSAMPLKHCTAVLTGAALVVMSPGAVDASAPAFAGDVTVDGVKTFVQERYEPASLESTLEIYAARWQSEVPAEPLVRDSVGAWHVLGQRTGVHYRTAQFAASAGGGTRVLLATRALQGPPSGSRTPIPLPVATHAVRTVATRASNRVATQTFAVSTQSAMALSSSLASLLERSGWRGVMPAERTFSGAAAARVSLWQRADEELLAVVGGGNPSTLLLHHVREARPAELRP